VEIYSGESRSVECHVYTNCVGIALLFNGQRGSLKNQYYPLNSGHFGKRYAPGITENDPGI